MRNILSVFIVVLSTQAGAVSITHTRSVSNCVERASGTVRAAFHPGELPFRCTRFLPTTRLAHAPRAERT